MGRSQYRLDHRHYRGVFTPGFFAHLNSTKFWQTDNDPFVKSRRRRKRILISLSLVVLLLLAWMVIESTRALRLF